MNILTIQRWTMNFIRGWGFTILAAVLIATSFKSAIADWNDVPTGSMKPTILVGDRVFINKLSYGLKVPYTTLHIARWGSPKPGDIIVFYSPADGKRLIKRLIALPGDKIELFQNKLYINQFQFPNIFHTHIQTSNKGHLMGPRCFRPGPRSSLPLRSLHFGTAPTIPLPPRMCACESVVC